MKFITYSLLSIAFSFNSSAKNSIEARIDIHGIDSEIKFNSYTAQGTGNIKPANWLKEMANYRLVATFPLSPEKWEQFTFSFVPEKSGTVRLELKGPNWKVNKKRVPCFVYYDSLEMTGAELKNPDFEKLTSSQSMPWPTGWSIPANVQPRASMATGKAFRKNGKQAIKVWHDSSTSQNIHVSKNKKVNIRMWIYTGKESLLSGTALPPEWGIHPVENSVIKRNPPSFWWSSTNQDATYTLQVSKTKDFSKIIYKKNHIPFNTFTPEVIFSKQKFFWRVKQDDISSQWSPTRIFSIHPEANSFPMPTYEKLFQKIPKEHPRLFIRPEDVAAFRTTSDKKLKDKLSLVLEEIDEKYLNKKLDFTPITVKDFPGGHTSAEGMNLFMRERKRMGLLGEATAALSFAYLVTEEEKYAIKSKKILLFFSQLDPHGLTSYFKHDYAAERILFLGSRSYTFLNQYLNAKEKKIIQKSIRQRGEDFYNGLLYKSQHLQRPFKSHENRAWAFLAEAGIAFYDEIPEAKKWLRLTFTVFYNVYPVWGGDNGGWHEGIDYFKEYLNRFSWYSDHMDTIFDINVFQHPYFKNAGYFPMYFVPPGTKGAGFGDLSYRPKESMWQLMYYLGRENNNPHWTWYANQPGYVFEPFNKDLVPFKGVHDYNNDYIGMLRAFRKRNDVATAKGKAPTELPSSRHFYGVGYVALNNNIINAKDNVSLLFKSSPYMGTLSHGYESQNSFIMHAFGERLFIRSGKRGDSGAKHHTEWMHRTKSQNNITINNKGQYRSSSTTKGEVLDFYTSKEFDYTVGEASSAYIDETTKRYSRNIVFLKPDLILIYDIIELTQPDYIWSHLHTLNDVQLKKNQFTVQVKDVSAKAWYLYPSNLDLVKESDFPCKHRKRIMDRIIKITGGPLIHHRVIAKTPEKTIGQVFITAINPYKPDEQKTPVKPQFKKVSGGFSVIVNKNKQEYTVLFKSPDDQKVSANGVTSDKDVSVNYIKNKRLYQFKFPRTD